ncbi:MAG: hydroxylamine oxidase, partial [Desulfobacterales bacterium]|nr:hydroxylamine oxidase [Desulfobacterales bacterium]
MKRVGILLCMGIIFFQNTIVSGADGSVSEATAECIDCHASIHPGIVRDWQNSRHAKIPPQNAMAVDGL